MPDRVQAGSRAKAGPGVQGLLPAEIPPLIDDGFDKRARIKELMDKGLPFNLAGQIAGREQMHHREAQKTPEERARMQDRLLEKFQSEGSNPHWVEEIKARQSERKIRTDNSYNTGGSVNMNRSFKMRQAPMQRQANRLASQGRYGDSMMVHMNPTEVDVLNQMSPGGLTRNPQTGQPEAFAFLAPLIASMAAKGALGAKLATIASLGGTVSPVVSGALASGITTTAQTGSLEEGIKSGLMSGLVGKIGGDLMKGMTGGVEATQQAGLKNALTLQGGPPIAESVIAGNPILDMSGQSVADLAGSNAGQALTDTIPTITPGVDPSQFAANFGDIAGGGLSDLTNVSGVTSAASGGGGGLGAGLGDTISNMNMADIGVPMVQGAIAEDAIAMYDGGGAPQEEEEDDFYQEVRPGDRGLQFPEFGYDAGASGEFDYFQNPFRTIPVAKNGGLLRRFEEGGQVDEPINLGGIRGFNQTSAPSFNFSGSNMYGPAPINQADFNLSSTPVDYSQANVASQVPVRSPFAGIGNFNFGGGGQREFGPSDADIYSFLSGTALPTNAGFQGSESIPNYAGTVETPALEDMQSYFAEQQMSSAPGRFGGEDLARAPLEQQVLSNYVPQTTYAAPMNRGPENVAANTGNWLGESVSSNTAPLMGLGMAGSQIGGPVTESPSGGLFGGWDFSGTGQRPAGDYESGFTSSYTLPTELAPYTPPAQDSIYSPQTTGMRIPGFGMSPNFRMMG